MRNNFVILFLLVSLTHTLFAASWNIYIDADFSGAKESARAIQKGIEVAIDRYLPEGTNLNIVIKNHRGNSKRSLAHLKEFYNDPKGLVIYCGVHSLPVLSNLGYINKNKIVLLDPWASAAPITRTPDNNGNKWVFRLSIDGSQAGEIITHNAIDIEGYKKPILILEDSGWGKVNEKTFKEALLKRGMPMAPIIWFDWQLGKLGAKQIMSDILSYKPDVIFLVASAIEGKTILKEISTCKEVIPVRSHWGITGGNIFSKLKNELTSGSLDLEFIQTSFLFTNPNLSSYQKEVWDIIVKKYDDIDNFEDLSAPLGFVHAYDLTKILLSILPNIETSQTISEQRSQLRMELENLSTPVNGLIKKYKKTFNNNNNFFSHEALSKEYLFMGYFNNNGAIILKD